MCQLPRNVTIVMADDDAEDREFAREALEEARVANPLHFVEDGEQLLDYLKRRGAFAHLEGQALPGLILLDLNMPRMDGREALARIKDDPDLRRIPVVILTTSKAEEDVFRTYDLGVNSYVKKPVDFEGLVDLMKALGRYWFEIVELPREGVAAGAHRAVTASDTLYRPRRAER